MTQTLISAAWLAESAEQVRERAATIQNELKPVIEKENKRVADVAPTFLAHGFVAFATAWIYTAATGTFKLPSGKTAGFDGTAWGLGVTGQGNYGVASFWVEESQLKGEMTFTVTGASLLVGGARVTWWKGGKLVGWYESLGIGLGISVTVGSGAWTQS